ncbi:MAG: hypothetical protein R3E46_18050 [Sedimenticolaceae bacterium]
MKKMWESIGSQLLDILAFPRHMNGGQVPTSLQNNNYVLGYHFMMCMNLYISAVQCKTNPEEQGFVLMSSLAIALGMEPTEIGKKLEPLMSNPDSEFTMGTEDANAAFALLLDGSSDAFLEFNNKIRGRY